jgi:lysophospholipase L1-like esterase
MVAIGDSITAGMRSNPTVAVANFSGSGNVGTMTNLTLNAPFAGATIYIGAINTNEWNGRKTIATADSVAGTYTFINDTPLTRIPTGSVAITEDFCGTMRDFLSQANGMCARPFYSIKCNAVSGTKSAYIYSRIDADVLPLNPTHVWVLAGTNDVLFSSDAALATNIATAYTNIQKICNKLIANGIRVFLSTLPPVTPGVGDVNGVPYSSVNGLQTTMTTSTPSSITVTNANSLSFPLSGIIQIDSEQMSYTRTVGSDTLTIVARNTNNVGAAAHSTNTTVTFKPVGLGVGVANQNGSAAMQAAILRLNDNIRKFARKTPGIQLVDFHKVVSNPTNGEWKAGNSLYTEDGVHPTGFATFQVALLLKSIFTGIGINNGYDPLVENANNYYNVDNASTQLWPDPLLVASTTSASLPSGFTGSYSSTLLPAVTSGAPTGSLSVVSRSDGFGNDQKVTITASTSADGMRFAIPNTGLINGSWAAYAGSTVKFTMSFSTTNVPDGAFKGIYVTFERAASPFGTYVAPILLAQSYALGGTQTYTVESPEFKIPVLPAGSTYGVSPNYVSAQIWFYFAGNMNGGSLQFGRIALDVIS